MKEAMEGIAGIGALKQIKRDHSIQDKLEGRAPSIRVKDRIELFFPNDEPLSTICEEMSYIGDLKDFKPDLTMVSAGKYTL